MANKILQCFAKNFSTKLITLFAIGIATSFVACACEDCEDSCSEITHFQRPLTNYAKTVNLFKIGDKVHYVHSDGFEFDLSVTKDTIYTENKTDFCAETSIENRDIQLKSNERDISVDIQFNGRIEYINEKEQSNFITPLYVYFEGTSFFVDLDSSGLPIESEVEGHVTMSNTVTFNDVSYDSVFVILDSRHFNARNYNEDSSELGDPAYLYFSKTKGILKIESLNGKRITIKEEH